MMISLKNCCRLCLKENINMFSLFNILSDTKISQKIEDVSGIKLLDKDGYPSSICNVCLEELNLVVDFILKCQNADKKILDMFPNIDQMNSEMSEEIQTIKIEKMYDSATEEYDGFKEESDEVTNVISEYNNKRKDTKKRSKLQKKSHFTGKNKRNRGPCECNACGLKLRSYSAMVIHWRVHTKEKPYSCSECSKQFSQKSSLHLHMERRHSSSTFPKIQERHFTCETCGKRFTNRANLKVHNRIHSGELPYKCEECGKCFAQLGSFSAHQRRHRGERPFVCKTCGKSFVEQSHLSRHYSVHSQDRPFVCNICGKGVKSHFGLKQHVKLHTNNKEHVCDKCGVSFLVKGNLVAHTRVVHSERSGQCLVCRKVCSNLQEHMTEHSGEKPHRCQICGKQFSRQRGLIVHSRQHSAAEKYKCDVPGCNTSFYAKWLLECHAFKHTGSTPYVCKFCTKGFLRSCHLTKHLKHNHPDEETNAEIIVHE